jgi:hypothetical protein
MTPRNGKERPAAYGPDGPHGELYQAPEINLIVENKTLDQQIKSGDNEALIRRLQDSRCLPTSSGRWMRRKSLASPSMH